MLTIVQLTRPVPTLLMWTQYQQYMLRPGFEPAPADIGIRQLTTQSHMGVVKILIL